jgi:hypothetical protein
MKRQQYEESLNKILQRLEQIYEQDKAVIQPRSSKPVTVNVEQLFAYGERFDGRKKLHEQLRALAFEPIED